jgi:hypothetical protein
MIELELTQEQREFLKNNFNNFSEEQINSKVQFSMWGGIPVGKPEELKDFCTMEGIERQLTKANVDNMKAAIIFYAHMYYPGKWQIEKMMISVEDLK